MDRTGIRDKRDTKRPKLSGVESDLGMKKQYNYINVHFKTKF